MCNVCCWWKSGYYYRRCKGLQCNRRWGSRVNNSSRNKDGTQGEWCAFQRIYCMCLCIVILCCTLFIKQTYFQLSQHLLLDQSAYNGLIKLMMCLLWPCKLTSSTYTMTWCVLLHFNNLWIALTFLMAYPHAQLSLHPLMCGSTDQAAHYHINF